MNFTKIFTLLLLTIFLAVPAMATDNNLEKSSWQLINTYWQVMDLNYQFGEQRTAANEAIVKTYVDSMQTLENQSKTLADTVVADLKAGNTTALDELSAIYKGLESYQKPAFEMVISSINEYMDAKQLETTLKNRADYFPGYGYAEPKFKYRKGKEVDREITSKYWQDEEQTTETDRTFEGMLEVELAAQLKNDSNVSNFRTMGEPMKINIGGHIKFYIKASFRTHKKLVTKAKKQYAVNKVWFELFRAPKTYWSTPTWELVGKTYELIHEPNGMVATVGADFTE